ncbi:MAG: hypothetical protein D6706_18655, partial [Chloroflexi bacterium]
ETGLVKPGTVHNGMTFGSAVSLHGAVLAVGAPGHPSCAAGVGGNRSDTGCAYAGAAYVYRHNGTHYVEEEFLKALNPRPHYSFGRSISVSSNATHEIIAVGSPNDASCGAGWGADPFNFTFSCMNTGAVTVFTRPRSGGSWVAVGFLKGGPPRSSFSAQFGYSMSLQGSRLAAGAPYETGPPAEHGAVYVLDLAYVGS